MNLQQKFGFVHQAFASTTHAEPIVCDTPQDTIAYLKANPQIDAVFCVNDPFAADLVTLMHANESELAQRIKVIGCDGNRKLWGNWTIELNVNQIAEMAVDLLHQQVNQGDNHEHRKVYHPVAIQA